MPTRSTRATQILAGCALAFAAAVVPAAAGGNPSVEFLNSNKILKSGALPFSEAVRHGDTLYLSGQIGIVPGTLKLAEGGLAAEAKQALENIRTILEANGRTTADLMKCTVMLADIAEWPTFNEVYKSFLKAPYPVRSAFATNGLAFGARVEVECIASAR